MQYLSIPKLTSPSVFMDQIPMHPLVPSQKFECHCGYSLQPKLSHATSQGAPFIHPQHLSPQDAAVGLEHLIQALLRFSAELSSLLPEGPSEQVRLQFYVSLLPTKLTTSSLTRVSVLIQRAVSSRTS